MAKKSTDAVNKLQRNLLGLGWLVSHPKSHSGSFKKKTQKKFEIFCPMMIPTRLKLATSLTAFQFKTSKITYRQQVQLLFDILSLRRILPTRKKKTFFGSRHPNRDTSLSRTSLKSFNFIFKIFLKSNPVFTIGVVSTIISGVLFVVKNPVEPYNRLSKNFVAFSSYVYTLKRKAKYGRNTLDCRKTNQKES